MREKYVIITDRPIIFGQNAAGIWRCIECPGDENNIFKKCLKMNKYLNKLNGAKIRDSEDMVVKLKKDRSGSRKSKLQKAGLEEIKK